MHRVLEGDRVWGGLEVWPSRNGVTRYRLTVYPPGASAVERRQQRLWRAWPLVAVLFWLVELSVFASAGPLPRAVFTASAVTMAGSVAWLTRKRCRPRRISVVKMTGFGGVETVGPYDDLVSGLERLESADAALHDGLITIVQHEASWTEVWESLAPSPRPAPPEHGH